MNALFGIEQKSAHLHPPPHVLLTRVLDARAAGQDRVRLAELSAVPGVRQDDSLLEVVSMMWPSVFAAQVDFRVAAVHLLAAAVCTLIMSVLSIRLCHYGSRMLIRLSSSLVDYHGTQRYYLVLML